jgi:hypothetical protein
VDLRRPEPGCFGLQPADHRIAGAGIGEAGGVDVEAEDPLHLQAGRPATSTVTAVPRWVTVTVTPVGSQVWSRPKPSLSSGPSPSGSRSM